MSYEKIRDEVLTESIQDFNSDEALEELINRHTPLCFSIYKNYKASIEASGHHFESFDLEKDTMIFDAAKSFDSEKGCKFSTWLAKNVNWECLDHIKEVKEVVGVPPDVLNELIDEKADFADYCEYEIVENTLLEKRLFDSVYKTLSEMKDKRIKCVFELRYGLNSVKKITWMKIAERLGVSRRTATNLHARGLTFLKGKREYQEKYRELI